MLKTMSGKIHKKLFFLFLLLGTTFSLPLFAAVKDSDADGLIDQAELNTYHTNPFNADTDNDGIDDTAEILHHTDPLKAETASSSLSIPKISLNRATSSKWLTWFIFSISGIAILGLMLSRIYLNFKKRTPLPPTAPTD